MAEHTRALQLDRLPRKVRSAFEHLLSLQHIDAETLATIIDAAELAGDWNKALWFTSSYLYLTRRGIPVRDVVAMAKRNRRRIRLEWSERRWQTEHDRLARYETLKALSLANERYDVSFFEARVPASFPGYFIRGSRRLGMEGLRQRHCVAVYGSRIKLGSTAILAVFLDGKRWTVELTKSAGSLKGIEVTQVKSRFNEPAKPSVQRRVCALLGLTNQDPEGDEEDSFTQREVNTACISAELRRLGVERVHVEFDGGGDEGCIQTVETFPAEIELEGHALLYRNLVTVWRGGTYVQQVIEQEKDLADAVRDLVYDYIESTSVDWCDGNGGLGSFTLDLSDNRLSYEVWERVMDYQVGARFDEALPDRVPDVPIYSPSNAGRMVPQQSPN